MIQVDGVVSVILLVIRIIALGGAAFALFHAARQRKDAFTAVDKLSKPIWLSILAVAFLVLLLFPAVQLFRHRRSRRSVRLSRRRTSACRRRAARASLVAANSLSLRNEVVDFARLDHDNGHCDNAMVVRRLPRS